ncbi:hypothetical protein, partial [Paractinoplanes toevensis]|uniref:hypothetical protein n=1 Tax=Paractinoplanes toevensis TaxID=571911 RepID=UPI001BB2FB7F
MRVGSMISKLLMAGTLAVSMTAVAAAPANAAVDDPAGTLVSTVDGTFTDATGAVGTVTGSFTPSEFAVQDDTIVATGVLHSVLTNADGTTAGETDTPVTLPLQLPTGSSGDVSTLAACNILHLVLGPLDLNLLGLHVHLNTVVLDITAISGPGNLLGNLLCAVAGLLD